MKKIIGGLGLIVPMLLNANCANMTNYQIATGNRDGTYFKIGQDLAKYIAPKSCIKLSVLPTNGSLDNSYKLRSPEFSKLKFAIVQNDVLQELEKLATEGNSKAKDLVENLRVIMPLYNEEIHIISKVGSNIKNFGDLKGKTLSIGQRKSGTTMTSFLLYQELFNKKLEYFQNEDFDSALKSLEQGKVDAIIKVAGQPIKRLDKKMNQSAKKHIQLLSYDERNSQHQPITSYYTTEIASKYYKWLDTDVSTLSTKAYLITFNYSNPRERKNIKRFAKTLIKNLEELKNRATNSSNTPHPKWKEVSTPCGSTLPGGWKYYAPIDEICNHPNSVDINLGGCTPYEISVGLCKK